MLGEIDDLVASGVINAESGEALSRHYEGLLANQGNGGKVVLLSVLGAALIGAGVILLIAHNWDALGRSARVFLSFLPLLISGALSIYALSKRAASTSWRESTGVAQSAGVAASIALISQTYHISGELSDFFFTCLVLILPIPYLFRAVVPALIYLAGIAVWAGTCESRVAANGGYWLFLAAILPFYLQIVWGDRLGKAASWLSGFVAASSTIGLFYVAVGFFSSGLWIPSFAGLFGVFYLVGVLGFPERRRHPLRVLGAAGILVLTVILSFKSMWPLPNRSIPHPPEWILYFQAAALLLAGAGLWGWAVRCKRDFNVEAAAFPALGIAAYGLLFFGGDPQGWGALGANLYGIALALVSAFRGLQQRVALTLNGGLVLFAALFVSRFMDSEFGALERGLVFILLGGLILGANLWMLKSKKGVAA